MANPSFELDANNDGRPDGWTTHTLVTRSSAVVRSGSYAMRHSATDNTGYTISQTLNGIVAGHAYNVGGWVNIPTTSDSFTFKVDLQWRNASNSVLSTKTIAAYTKQTSSWSQAAANLVAPSGATNAVLRMVVSSLKASVYVDDLVFQDTGRLANGGFEWDANTDGRPDSWSSNSAFTRSTVASRAGYVGRHAASSNTGYTISQTVGSLSAGQTYSFSGWVYIPPTTDAFSFKIELQWRNASGSTIATSEIKTFSAATSQWQQVTANLAAPAGAASAQLRMVVSSLNATVYVDDWVLQP